MDITNMKRVPLNGTFELTARCNLRCKMCLIRIDNDNRQYLKERSTKEWIDMARQVQEAGTLGLLITGGEPMLRPDFADIYTEIANMGFVVTVYTNATLLTDEIYKVFLKYPPHNIGITVYGASGKTYDLVAGSYEAYDRMLAGVDKLRRLPSKLNIRTTIIKDNLEDLDKISSWANSLGPEVVFNVSRIVTMPVRGGTADVKSCRLSPRQNVNMMKKIYSQQVIDPLIKVIKSNPEICQDKKFLEILMSREEVGNKGNKGYTGDMGNKSDERSAYRQTLYGCNAGINSYTITWDGRLIGCQMLDDCCTYPFTEGFIRAWDSFPGQVKLLPVPAKCRDCTTPCTSCYATRLSETGSMGGWPEYICREAKLKQKMEKEIVEKLYVSIAKD